MGACSFSTVAVGKTADDAMRAAREAAYWEHGHGGYTGTIAEKDGYVEFTLPTRITAARFTEVVWNAVHEKWGNEGRAYENLKPNPTPNLDLLAKWLGKTAAASIVRVVDEKWGPCVAVRLGATEARPHIPKTPTGKNKVGYNAYLFFGTASC